MRRLLLPLTFSIALLACGSVAQPTASARARYQSCPRVELSHVRTLVSAGRATLNWEIASTANVAHFLIEGKLGGGRWRKYAQPAAAARSDTLTALAEGPAEFRIWAVLERAAGPAPAPLQAGSIAVGLDAGYWGPCTPAELRTAVEYVRLETPYTIAPWTQAGLKVIADESGPYKSSGVSGLDVKAYVGRIVKLVQASPELWAVEVLNEPGGSWFWGEHAESQANRSAYAQLVIAVHDALVAHFGAKRPLILASYDGGDSSSTAWGRAWTQNKTALADADMLTMHPYGGTEDRAQASLGDRANVEAAHLQTGKPIAITEVGFPTEQSTSDSMQYSEAEQAHDIAGVIAWARSTGYVSAITIFGFRDGEAGGPGYGIETHDGRKKPAWSALIRAAASARG